MGWSFQIINQSRVAICTVNAVLNRFDALGLHYAFKFTHCFSFWHFFFILSLYYSHFYCFYFLPNNQAANCMIHSQLQCSYLLTSLKSVLYIHELLVIF